MLAAVEGFLKRGRMGRVVRSANSLIDDCTYRLCVCWAIATFACLHIHASAFIFYVPGIELCGTDCSTKVFSVSLKTLECREFASSEWQAEKVSVSPSGKLVAATFFRRFSYEGKLVVFSDDGRQLIELTNVMPTFAWSPDGNCLAYATGNVSDIGIVSTGTWLYDMRSGKSRRVLADGAGLSWARYDHNLYILRSLTQVPKVVKYDVTTGDVVDTPFRDIRFSPDGKFYVYAPVEEEARLYMRETNSDITEEFEFFKRYEWHGPFSDWLVGKYLVYCVSTYLDKMVFLFNPYDGGTHAVPGRVLTVTDDGQWVIFVKPGGNLAKELVSELTAVDAAWLDAHPEYAPRPRRPVYDPATVSEVDTPAGKAPSRP